MKPVGTEALPLFELPAPTAKRGAPPTSHDAAKAAAGRQHVVFEAAMRALAEHPDGLTADECAALVGVDRLYMRPRFSEARRLGLIAPNGRRRNASGLAATVWVRTEEAR